MLNNTISRNSDGTLTVVVNQNKLFSVVLTETTYMAKFIGTINPLVYSVGQKVHKPTAIMKRMVKEIAAINFKPIAGNRGIIYGSTIKEPKQLWKA